MGKKFLVSISIIGIFFLFPLASHNKYGEEKTRLLAVAEKDSKGDLHVITVTPKGITQAPHEAETIVVIFDQPMVPLEDLYERKGSSFLKLDPAFSGKYRWMGTKTLTFTPDKRFPYATKIKVTVPAGTRSINGYTLKKDFAWSFSSIRPVLVNHLPGNEQKWVKLDSKILLVFNQAILKEKAKGFLSVMGVDKKQIKTDVDFSLESPSAKQMEEEKIEASRDEVLLLKPREKLKPDFTYYVEVKTGLPGKEGPLGMEKWHLFKFETFKEFRFEKMEETENINPRWPIVLHFSNPVNDEELVKKIRFEPELEIRQAIGGWGHPDISLYLSLEPETEYTLWIDPELEDEFGSKLRKEVKLKFSTSSYPPLVAITQGHNVLEAYGEMKYRFYALNTKRVFLQAARIKEEDVIPLLTTKDLFWTKEKFFKKNFFQIQKPLKVQLARNEGKMVPIDLKDLLPEKYGLVFIHVDTGMKEEILELYRWHELYRHQRAFIQVTDMGISAKFSPENNLIWVTKLKTGLPVPDAEVEIRDDSNKIHWRGRTDKEGRVETPGWKLLGLRRIDKWSNPCQWVFVKKEKDLAFISSEWNSGRDPYEFDIMYDSTPEPVKIQGYIFSERGIYRTGEKVHIKGIIRKKEKGKFKIPEMKKIEYEIQDPLNKIVFKDKTILDEFGSFALDLETDEDAALGKYQIKAKIPLEKKSEETTVIHGSFRVEAFRPAEFEVHLDSLKDNYILGEDYQAHLRANYLFGAAMAGQKVSWHLRLNPTSFSPPEHKDYIFGNQIDGWDEVDSRLLASGESSLDTEGKLIIKARLLPEKEKDSVLASLEAEVQGPSRRSISSRTQTIVHRGEYYIGLKPSTTFLKKGEKLKVNIITSSPEGKILPEKKIIIRLIKREWHSTRKKDISGMSHWESEKKDIEIDSRQIQTKKDPFQVSFFPEKSGFYLLKSEAKDSLSNKITTSTFFYVTGKDYIPWERREEDIVELVADSEHYFPGDLAKILVKSPYKRARALVTVERESVMESKVLEIQGGSSQIEILILSDHIPNVYVSVLLVQGRTSPKEAEKNEDIGRPSYKIGYINLSVDPSEKRLKIDIQKDKKTYKPKDKVTLDIRVKDWKGAGTKACISLAAVDLGVLNLIGYETPDPFAQFYAHESLSVHSSETRAILAGKEEILESLSACCMAGPGAKRTAISGFAGLEEIELREVFKFTAYWNPSLLTDEEGKTSVSFTLPDNLTTFRIMAVAQTLESQFGRAESTFKVSKLLILQPALPRFARLGDKFKGGVVAHNHSSKKREVVLECKAKGILFLEEENFRRFSLNPEEGKEILFSFEVEKPGKAVLSFRAQMGEEADGLKITFPLKMPRPTETVALFEHTTESKEEKIRIPEEIYRSKSEIEFQGSSTALSGLKGCVDYLTNYPYLCLEQRLSSILPYIVAYDVILDFKLSKLEREEIQKHVRKTIKEIYNYQKSNGGFGFWPDSAHDSPFITCYAAFALAKAQKADYEVSTEKLYKVSQYLKYLIRGGLSKEGYPYSTRSWNTIKAFALYNLALLNQAEPSYAEKLFQERSHLSLFGQTLLLKALNQSKGSPQAQNTLLQELMNKIKVTPTKAHFEDDEGRRGGWIYSSNTRTTAFILQSMIEIGSDHSLLPVIARWLVEQRKAGHWSSTQENFFVFYALNDFYRLYEKIKPNFKVEVSLAGKLLLKEIFKGRKGKAAKAEVSLTHFQPGKTLPLKIQKKGDGALYYSTRMIYAPRQKLLARDEGFAVYKKIQTLDGKPVDSVKAGSLVVISLQIVTPRESLFVVIDDPLPAGLEAVNPAFVTGSKEQQQKLEQFAQRRRTRWWQGFNHTEMHDDRVLLFADNLAPGIHTHRYLARALTFGTFHAPGMKAEEMYSPEVFGRSPELTIKIVK